MRCAHQGKGSRSNNWTRASLGQVPGHASRPGIWPRVHGDLCWMLGRLALVREAPAGRSGCPRRPPRRPISRQRGLRAERNRWPPQGSSWKGDGPARAVRGARRSRAPGETLFLDWRDRGCGLRQAGSEGGSRRATTGVGRHFRRAAACNVPDAQYARRGQAPGCKQASGPHTVATASLYVAGIHPSRAPAQATQEQGERAEGPPCARITAGQQPSSGCGVRLPFTTQQWPVVHGHERKTRTLGRLASSEG